MVASKILGLYARVWEPLLNNDLTGSDIIEFSKQLPKLRSALSCCVCSHLLINRKALSPAECREHFACKDCVGKERADNKKCKRCNDWNTYEEDETLTLILKSYQDFCFFFLTSERIVRVLEVKHEVDPKFDTFRLIDLVKEGLNGFQRAKKRKLSSNAAIKQKTISDINNHQSSQSPISNDNNNTSVREGKRTVNEETQEKNVKTKAKPSCEASVPGKAPPTSSPSFKPFASVKSLSATSSSTICASSVPVEPRRSGVSSPPLVTIKVEVQTTPEKQQSQNDGDDSSSSSSTFQTPDPLLDPLGEQSRSPTLPILVSRSSMGSVPSPFITSSSCNTSTLPYKITPTSVVSSHSNMAPHIIQIAHPTGIKTVSIRPQQIRLAGIHGGRIPVQILGTTAGTLTTTTSSTSDSIRAPIITKTPPGLPTATTAPPVKRRIIFTTATPHDLQRWPDTSKILQFATGDLSRFPSLAGMRPSLISVGQPSCSIAGIRTAISTTNARPVVTSSNLPLVRPPNTSTMTNVLSSTGTSLGQSQNVFASIANQGLQTHASSFPLVRCATSTTSSSSMGSVVRPQGLPVSASTVTRQVPVSSPSTTSPVPAVKRKPEGCRCGNATPTPGKLTCIGQRCACYADRNACSDCKCKGCKNPYVPGSGGRKMIQGVRAFIDPQTNQTIPIIATHVGHGPGHPGVITGIPTSSVSQTNPPLVTAVGPSPNFGTMQSGNGVSSSMSQPVPPFQFIPVRFGPSGTPQYLQIANPHALHQMPIIFSTSGHLQTNSPSGITIQGIPVSGLSAGGIQQLSQHMQQQRMAQSQMNIKPERPQD